ncbi:hypothetical protein GCM10020220_114860 [Nonomuraea rubra]
MSRGLRLNRASALELASARLPETSTTIWATGPELSATDASVGRRAARSAAAPATDHGARLPWWTDLIFLNRRIRRSTGSNLSLWLSSISALPRNRNPGSDSAKWKRRTMLSCISVLKYISVLRASSRSTREIGASWVRSLRPKMSWRRRSRRKVKPLSTCSK